MGNSPGGKHFFFGGDKFSSLLCNVFAKYAQADDKADMSAVDYDECIKSLAKSGEGPFKGLKEIFMHNCKANSHRALTKQKFSEMMRHICMLSEEWFPSYIVAKNMPEQKKMEIIEHFVRNYEHIRRKLIESINKTFTSIDSEGRNMVTWEQFSVNFFGIVLKTLQAAQADSMMHEIKEKTSIENGIEITRKMELEEIFHKVAKGKVEKVLPPTLLLEEMKKHLLESVRCSSTDAEIKKVFSSLFEYIEGRVDLKTKLSKASFIKLFLESWSEFVEIADRLVHFPRGSYAEVYSRRHCRWKLGLVNKFLVEECQLWVKLYLPTNNEAKTVNILNRNLLQKIQWTRGREVEVKDGGDFFKGVVSFSKVDDENVEWVGTEYIDGSLNVKKIKIASKYCPKLFRPVQNENGIRFGYSITLSSCFYDADIHSYRYLMEVNGPKSRWWIAKNFTIMKNFWNSIKKSIDFPGIEFPKGKIIGSRERKFIQQRKEELATFWRRFSRVLHLVDDSTLQKVASFLELPFVSQEMYKRSLRKKTYIRLLRLENLPIILDDQGKERPRHTYVRMKINDDINSNDDVEEWITKSDSSAPVWNATRPLVANGKHLTVEVWHDNFGGQPDLKIAKIVMETSRLDLNQKAAISIPLHKKVTPNPNGMCKVVLQMVPAPPKEKWLYLIRHGQSKWNAAKREFDLLTAFGIIDHGLTKLGAQQAEELRQKLKEPQFARTDNPMYTGFYNANKVYSSPLTRAVESAVLALRDHPQVKNDGIHLLADAREKRSLMGMDCTGQFRGKDIIPHIHSEFKDLFGEEMGDDVKNVDIRPNDSVHRWWNSKGESRSAFAERIDQMMKNIMYDDSDSVIVVCHSMVIRHIFKSYLSPDFSRKDEITAHDLAFEKLQNIGVAGMLIDRTKFECIQRAALMFGSIVLKNKQNKRRSTIPKSPSVDEKSNKSLPEQQRVDFKAIFNSKPVDGISSLKVKK